MLQTGGRRRVARLSVPDPLLTPGMAWVSGQTSFDFGLGQGSFNINH
jgi:hypothetical protein